MSEKYNDQTDIPSTQSPDNFPSVESYWRGMIKGYHQARQKHAGLSINAYCRSKDIVYGQYLYWNKKISKPAHGQFVQSILPANINQTKGAVVFKQGVRLEIYSEAILIQWLSGLL